MLIQLSGASFYYNEKKIFENVSLQINEGDKIGFVGRNGQGKTTLIQTLTKELELRDGTVSRKSNLSVGYLRQNSGLVSGNTVYGEMAEIFSDLAETEKEMRSLERQMSALGHDSEEYKRAAERYDAKTAYFESKDGYNAEVKIKTVLNGMGFSGKYEQIINTMSGGEKTRLAICRLLLLSPELLILDEPTNHLDFSTLQWLEGFLSSYKGALLLVSHDRYFLDKLVTKVWEIENYGVDEYSGNYSKFRELKAAFLERSQKEYGRQQEKIAKMLDYAARNIARASTSNSAKSRLKQVENMEKTDKPFVENRKPFFRFAFETPSFKNALSVKNLTLTAGGRNLLENVSLEILRGEKAALIGANGTGKSTFIKKIMAAANDAVGPIHIGQGVTVAYYDQENVNLDPDATVLSAVWGKHFRLSQTTVRKTLAQALLSEEDVGKRVKELSGGERAKLGIAMMTLENANTLVLDEPTNHLDLTSRESLEEALAAFEGTILFVSHDRYFINRLAQKVVEIEDKTFVEYEGDFDAYLMQKSKQTPKAAEYEKEPPKNINAERFGKEQRREKANAKIRLKEVESRIADLESELEKLENEIVSPAVTSDYRLLKQKCGEADEKKKRLEALLAEWEILAAALI